ncbi:MAG TPA: M23 family metallopeptidase [Deltaproteobacteria bacterium]|nr:M23 family metallopeptidase [Deltaproteobacteria bacterium]
MAHAKTPLFLRFRISAPTTVVIFVVLLASLVSAAGQDPATETQGGNRAQAVREGSSDRTIPLKKSVVIRKGDIFSEILVRQGVSLADALEVSRKANKVCRLTSLKPGDVLELSFTPDGVGLEEIAHKAPGKKPLVLYHSSVVAIAGNRQKAPVATGVQAPPARAQAVREGSSDRTIPLKKAVVIRKGDIFSEILVREGVSLADALEVSRKANKVCRLTSLKPGDVLELSFTPDGVGLEEIAHKAPGKKPLVLYHSSVVAIAGTRQKAPVATVATDPGRAIPQKRKDVSRADASPETSDLDASHDMSLVSSYDLGPLPVLRHPAQLKYELLAQGKVLSPIAPLWVTSVHPTPFDHSKDKGALSIAKAKERLASKQRHPSKSASRKKTDDGFLRAPVSYRYVSSGFTASRVHPITGDVLPHYGVDFAAHMGTPVHAVGSGRVIFAGWDGGFGKVVRIRHTNGYITHYGHLSKFAKGIRPGKKVKRGQTIGYVGMTGVATGPHLDFRITRNGRFVNPFTILNNSKRVTAKKSRHHRG